MKEELQGKLAEILGNIQTAAGKAGDFALEQMSDIAQSYVAYGRVMGTLEAVVSILALLMCCWMVWWGAIGHAKDEKNDWRFSETPFAISLFGFLGGCLCLMAAAVTVPNALLVWFAPKVWLLKQLAMLVK